MSDLTQCNYCSLKGIRRRAKKDGNKVHTKRNSVWCNGGVNIYVAPSDELTPKGGIVEDSEFHKAYWVSWFMELSDGCVC